MRRLLVVVVYAFASMLVWQSASAENAINVTDTSAFIEDVRIQRLADSYTEQQADISSTETVLAAGAAPPLTYLEVYAVISSQYPTYEYIAQNQFSTVNDHGGAEMYVVTVELGYGGNPIARLNGGYLTEIQNQPIVDSYGTIVGWYRWWNSSGYQNGYFTYQNTSLNYPWNTMSDSLSIL